MPIPGYANPGIEAKQVLAHAGVPSNGTSEIQHIDITGSPTGGSFRASWKGEPFSVAYNATTTELQTTLRALGRIGGAHVTVTGSAGAWVVTFGGHLAKLNVPAIVIVENLLAGGTAPAVAVTTATPGVTATARGAQPGQELRDTTNGTNYLNTGTIYAPVWTLQTSPSVEMAALEAAIPATNVPALTYSAVTGAGGANATLQGNAGRVLLPLRMNLTDLSAADLVTEYTPGFIGRVLAVDAIVATAATAASKAASINLEIGTTNLSGGVVALTSSNCGTKGAVVAGTAVSGSNTFTASDVLSVEASAVTAFTEGAVQLMVTLQNDEALNNFADLAAKVDAILSLLQTTGIMA